ncbi:MAG: hypothetical protein ACYSUN_16930 [Planctomycetota bacterium]|jgi:hypothetical protein
MPAVTISESIDWRKAHERLVEHKERRAVLDYDEGELLLEAHRAVVHVYLGYATFEQYIDFLLGHTPRMTSERLRVARCLRELPELARALREGDINWSSARELTRVAVAETETEWLAAAEGKAVRQVEELVSGYLPGDSPSDLVRPEVRRHVLRMEVTAETYALFREAEGKLRRDSGGSLADDDALLLMARQILEGPKDEGRAGYQVAMSVCPECARGVIEARGEEVQVGPEVVEMACCDAQHIGDVGQSADTHVGRATQDIPPAIRRQVMRRDGGRCQTPGCRCSLWVDVHHIRLRSEGGDHDPDLLLVLCAAHHRAMHRGALLLEGTVSSGLEFRHADGTRFGGPVHAETAAACLDAQAALRSFGFGESESRLAVAQAREDPQSSEVPGELLRAALRVLRPLSVREGRVEYRVTPTGLGERCVAPGDRVRRGRERIAPHTARRARAPAHGFSGEARPPSRREVGTARGYAYAISGS